MSDELVRAVASGLRNMKEKPDAFLYCSESEEVWDKDNILGIPVYHSVFVRNTATDLDIPFIPMWLKEKCYISARADFHSGYEAESG